MHKIRIVIRGETLSNVEIIEIPDKRTQIKAEKFAAGLERLKKAVMGNEVPACAESR